MTEESFSKLLRNSFRQAQENAANIGKRTRIDVRTAGFPSPADKLTTEWMGMSPAPGKGDFWHVLVAEEKSNQFLLQANQNERLVEIVRVIGKDKPLTFAEAVEYLAVWEYSQIVKGTQPVAAQKPEALGTRYFKDMVMRRGYLITTSGAINAAEDILPTEAGKYLKSDMDALQRYQDGLRGDNILNELIRTKNPLYISETSIEEDLENFGDIGIFDKIRFFADILVKYASVKLDYVQDFFANPNRQDLQVELPALLSQSEFFDKQMVTRMETARSEIASSVFRFFYVDPKDWEKELDLNDRKLRVELLKNPDAQEAYDYLTRPIAHPLTEADVQTMLFVSARSLVYMRDMMKDSPQAEALERQNIYNAGDIDDLLNFLDLLEIKFRYMTLAEAAVALPGTQKFKDLSERKDDFKGRIDRFKKNLRESQELSPTQEKQIDGFIKASTPVYLLDHVTALPEKLKKAYEYVTERTLPHQNQLRLDLDFSGGTVKQKITAPTRKII